MDKSTIVEQGASLFTFDGLRGAVESTASNPKVATVVAGSSMGMGFMSSELAQSIAGQVTLFAGAITAVIVAVIQSIKLIRMLRGRE